jgi:hypothetical protein
LLQAVQASAVPVLITASVLISPDAHDPDTSYPSGLQLPPLCHYQIDQYQRRKQMIGILLQPP